MENCRFGRNRTVERVITLRYRFFQLLDGRVEEAVIAYLLFTVYGAGKSSQSIQLSYSLDPNIGFQLEASTNF